MRTSGFYSDVPYRRLPAGGPATEPPTIRDAARERDPARRRIIASYLAGGTAISRSPGRARDVFDEATRVSLDLVTDGEWIWPLDAAHYCERYGVLPEADLVQRALENAGTCGPVRRELALRIAHDFFESARASH